MDLRRARIQDWLVGGLGALLTLSLFLPWYSGCGTRSMDVGFTGASALSCRGYGEALGAPFTGWSAFAVVDVILAATGALAVLALMLTLVQRTPALPLGLTSLGTLLAVVAVVLAVVRLLVPPGAVDAAAGGSATTLPAAWVGTAAALGLLAAMLASIRDERTPVPARSLAEQAAAIRTLSLSSAGGAEPADAGRTEARKGT